MCNGGGIAKVWQDVGLAGAEDEVGIGGRNAHNPDTGLPDTEVGESGGKGGYGMLIILT